jgi:predicted RNA binding protein YcfA (HicA-like mRNA interferase family)
VALINLPRKVKYNELHKILRKAGMIQLGEQRAGHPLWLNPHTGEKFTTSNHGSHEVAPGTLKSILNSAGLEKNN